MDAVSADSVTDSIEIAEEYPAPSPGTWTPEPIHFGRPHSVFAAVDFFKATEIGMARSLERYGGPIENVEFKLSNRIAFMCVRPVGAPPDADKLPPKWLFKLIQTVHPKIGKWRRRANRAYRDKSWRPHIAWWDNEEKPWSIARAGELREVDPGTLNDEDLITHLTECKAFFLRTAETHHVLNMSFMLPLGDFLNQAKGWTDLSTSELLGLFEGYSGASKGAVVQLEQLRAALDNDAEMAALVRSDIAPSKILATLGGGRGAVATALKAYLDYDGYRTVTGYDVADMMFIESPEVVIRVIRSVIENTGDRDTTPGGDRWTDGIREKVPPKHRLQFDELLAEARSVFRIREERGAMADALSTGLTRRAILEAGRRLEKQGKVLAADQLVDATLDEIAALIRGSDSPSAVEIKLRADFRINHDFSDVPKYLGSKPIEPPPADWFPKSARRAQQAFQKIFSLMLNGGKSVSDETVIRGLPVYPGVYEGTARVVADMFDMEKIEDGDILVSRMTAPSFNAIFPMLGAVVTDQGGLLCHAAITAREFAIPAVIGCEDATTLIADGMRLHVDGALGEVRIIG